MLNSKDLYDYQRYYTITRITDSIRRYDAYKGVFTVDALNTVYNPASGLIQTTYSSYDRYTNTTLIQRNFKINFKPNHLTINNSTNQLEISANLFQFRDFYYNPAVTQFNLELMEISRPYLSIPLNVSNCRTATYIAVTALKLPLTYPYFDSSSFGRSNLGRLHSERLRAIQEIKVLYANESLTASLWASIP
jgi:hypothetical protein